MAKRKKILFFDDEKFISGFLAKNLRLNGWHVVLVDKIDKLFMELNKQQYDVIIIDIMAPIPASKISTISFTNNEIKEMDGGMNTGVVIAIKIWDQIKKNQSILFLSARKQPESIKKFKEDGKKCDYLRKPELARNIDIILRRMLFDK